MRTEYDFSDSVKNPYIKELNKKITIIVDENTLTYFQQLAEQKGVSYQNLIALYLRDCATQHRQASQMDIDSVNKQHL